MDRYERGIYRQDHLFTTITIAILTEVVAMGMIMEAAVEGREARITDGTPIRTMMMEHPQTAMAIMTTTTMMTVMMDPSLRP